MTLFSTILSLAMALTGCGGDDTDEAPVSAVTITAQPEHIDAPAAGGTYTVDVTTTGKEWGAYVDQPFVTIQPKGTTSQQGTVRRRTQLVGMFARNRTGGTLSVGSR